ncbi:MAG: septum formation initiator family protein [Desulfobacterota bacterium]|nr:septum formation initiator family protein [Thermodesulfobacteriota bacterium]
MKRIVITSGFLATMITLLLLTMFGQRGFIHVTRLQSELREIEKKNVLLRQENEMIKRDIELLRNNLKYIEELARKELGFVKEGERVYRLGEGKR